MSVTIADVAKAAGVSISTVSKVTSGSHTISSETADRVKGAMKQLGYRPNARAQGFARQATRHVVFLASLPRDVAFQNPHMFEILAGAEGALAAKGFTVTLRGCTPKEVCPLVEDIMARKEADGLLLHASIVTRELSLFVTRADIPHIVIGMPSFSNQLCWIDNNNRLAGELAARHLVERGYKRVAFIGDSPADKISQSRLLGAADTLAEEGLWQGDALVRQGEPTIEDGVRMTAELLAQKPDAFICSNNYLAVGCLRLLRREGVRVPEQAGVITFDDYPFAQTAQPPLTTMNIDVYDMGVQAGKLITKKINKPKLQIQSFTTLPDLIARESTARTAGVE